MPVYPGAWDKTKDPQMRAGGSEFVGVHHVVHVRRFEFQPAVEELLDVKEVPLVVIAGQLVVGVLGQVVLVREEGPDAPQLQDALAAIHNGQLVPAHKLFATMSSGKFI